MAKEYEIIDHTADVGVAAYGADVRQAFANAAKGLFSLITELRDVRQVECRDIEVTAADQEGLLVAWLNELLYYFDAENMLFSRFEINRLADTELKARACGERADRSRHALKLGVKAATYHMLKIDSEDGVRVRVLFDI